LAESANEQQAESSLSREQRERENKGTVEMKSKESAGGNKNKTIDTLSKLIQ